MNTEEKSVRNKLRLIKPAGTLNNVSEICMVMGCPQDNLLRFKKVYKQRCKPVFKKNICEPTRTYGMNLKPFIQENTRGDAAPSFLYSKKLANDKILDKIQQKDDTVREVSSVR